MKKPLSFLAKPVVLLIMLNACDHGTAPNREMIRLLSEAYDRGYSAKNPFCPEARFEFFQTMLENSPNKKDSVEYNFTIAQAMLELGQEDKAIMILEDILHGLSRYNEREAPVLKTLAMANLRLGERMNCINSHSNESCIFPIAGAGVHRNQAGSEKAIEIYRRILQNDPGDLESQWLLNIAYMTVGGYPQRVPPEFLIAELDTDTLHEVKPFIDVAVNIGLNTKNMGGGTILDDLNNDGYLDLVTSGWGLKEGMHYCRNNSDGTFTDISDSSGLSSLTGGLNMMQTDYNNDGLKDIFVLRGAWLGEFGTQPNSLLRNNGNGTFTDVTRESGLLSYHPTQTATWADFDNDGWLDLFIGNETSNPGKPQPCELYVNNRNGTFTETAAKAGCQVALFVKGVTSGDYNNDGLPDIFISTLNGQKILLKNETATSTGIHFKDVTKEAGLDQNKARTFPTWFWDYDNDGWLDILVCGYEFQKSLAWYAAAEAMHKSVGNAGKLFLFRNNHDGSFEDVSQKAGLDKIAFAMGANFGDIDNDGYLDIYLGTGNPLYQSLVPNKMFKNKGGRSFIDVTTAARVGNLQKGHGISFADLDNDGDQDIYIDMGGAYAGDAYQNSLYINPGQNNNHWIKISLEGITCNRAAIGAKIKVVFEENGTERFVYREVNSGGSFGANPLTQHIGIGQSDKVRRIEIQWPGGKGSQVFNDVRPDQTIFIQEGNDQLTKATYARVDFINEKRGLISCAPAK